MTKSKMIIDSNVLNKITESTILNNTDKIHFLKFVGYMTNSEKKELVEII